MAVLVFRIISTNNLLKIQNKIDVSDSPYLAYRLIGMGDIIILKKPCGKSHSQSIKFIMLISCNKSKNKQRRIKPEAGVGSNKTQKSKNILPTIKPEAGFIGQPEPLNKKQHMKIIDQMTNSVCRIVIGNKIGTGFLCLIPFPTIEYRLKVLITCNHVFNDITKGNKIKIIFDNKIEKEIIIDGIRKVYTSNRKEYDITIIELKDNEFDIRYYLQIDDDLFLKNEIKINQQIYIIHYPKGIEVKSNNGTIQKIIGNEIMYYLCTYEGSSGAPIFNLNNFKVIGIHLGYDNKYNIGEIIKIPIIDFYQKCNLKNNINKIKEIKEIKEEKIINEINIILEIEKNDINEIIYYLDNTEKHDNLKELN